MTVDPDLIRAGNDAVAEGRADSLSAWVNLALADRVARDRRLEALAAAVAGYERIHGVITPQELAEQARSDRMAARVVRGVREPAARPRPARGRGAG